MVTNIKQAILEAQAEIMEAMDAIQKEAQTEQMNRDAKKLWVSMPDELKEQFKLQQPAAYREFMREMKINRR